MKKINKYIFWSLLLVLCSTSCLDLQDSYDYEPSDLDNNLYMSTWDYISTEKETFAILKEAIELLDMQEYYTQDENEYTYILMNDKAFTTKHWVYRPLQI